MLIGLKRAIWLWFGLLACVLCTVPASAQTTTKKLAWDQPLASGQTFADVQKYLYAITVDTGTPSPMTATCVNGGTIACTAPLPALAPGQHTLKLTATNGFDSASTSISGGPPAAPVSVTITVTVTIP